MATKKTPPKKAAPAEKAAAPKLPCTRDEMEQAAKDLNQLLELNPPIDLKIEDIELAEMIKAGGNLANPADDLSAATWHVMSQLGCTVKRAEPKAPEKKAPTGAAARGPRDPFENPSAVTLVMMCVVDTPTASIEDIRAYLGKNGKSASDSTITMIAADTRKTLTYIAKKSA